MKGVETRPSQEQGGQGTPRPSDHHSWGCRADGESGRSI